MASRDRRDGTVTFDGPGVVAGKDAGADAEAETSVEGPAARVQARAVTAPQLVNGGELPERFDVKRLLARGGMGVVYEVHDKTLDRDVAVKLLPAERKDERELRARLVREARAAAVLDHPNIVRVFDVDPAGAFIVMELVRGESLDDRLRREKRLPADEVRRVGVALLQALAAAHAASIVHRDVKPSNVLLDAGGVVKLADFGIAHFGDSDLTSTGTRVGTPAYMAPEQLRGQVADARADVYAAGATLFEIATGNKLHQRDGKLDDVDRLVRDAAGDAGMAAAIARAVRDKPGERFATAAAFFEAWKAAAPAAPAPAPERAPAPVAVVAGARRPRAHVLAWLLAAGVLAAAGAIAWQRWPRAAGLHEPGATGEAPPAPPVIAVLPFQDRTGIAELDFSEAGLPHLAGSELRRVPGLGVIGYYQLRQRMTGEPQGDQAWRDGARAAGATLILRGELQASGERVRVLVTLEDLSSGRALATVERTSAVEDVPAAVRALLGEVAGVALGRPVALGGAENLAFEVERSLQIGIEALERHDLVRAHDNLRKAAQAAPWLADAQYYLALATWWHGLPRAETLGHIEQALAGQLDDARRGFLEGLRRLLDNDFPAAVAHFRALERRFPEHRDILYGLFEAQFHGGHTAEAMETYRHVVQVAPAFDLGSLHAITYYLIHDDAAGVTWALERVDATRQPVNRLWYARALEARRDYDGALREIQALSEAHLDESSASYVRNELLAVYMVTRRLALARAHIQPFAETDPWAWALYLMALADATGDGKERDRWMGVFASGVDSRVVGNLRVISWSNLAAYAAATGEEAVARAAQAGMDGALRDEPGATGPTVALRALLAGATGEAGPVDAARASGFPEAVAIGDALVAAREGNHAAAAAAWRRAIQHATEERLVLVEWLQLARAERAAGNPEGVIRACGEVVQPRVFWLGWGAAAGPCLSWMADANAELGRHAEAATAARQLLELRARARPGDPLVAGARRHIKP